MTRQYTYTGNRKPIVRVAVAGLAIATLLSKLNGATTQGCNLLEETAWVALRIWHVVILLADWHALPVCFCEESRILQHLLQIGESIWPLLCAMAG
jgi:hypothetical protein